MKENYDTLITRYLSNELSGDDQDKLESLRGNKEFEDRLKVFQDIWNSYNHERPVTFSLENEWDNLDQKLQGAKKDHYRYIRYAALFLMCISFYFFFFTSEKNNVLFAKDSDKKITLVDGTNIVLKEGSKLSYFTDLKDTQRLVYLNGSAYFDVAKSNTKFVVKTTFTTTRVLGTAFDIIESDHETKIFVEHGKVSFQSTKHSEKKRFLTAGEMSISKNNEIPSEPQNIIEYTKSHYIFFDNVLIDEALKKVESIFDVKIQNNLPSSSLRISSKLSRNKSVKNLLKLLGDHHGFRVLINDEKSFTVEKM